MKKTIYILLFLLPAVCIQAQHNPFASINKPGKVVTLSNDKYVETHLNDSLQRIGSVIVNMNTGTIHQLLDLDSIDKTDRIDPTVATRWYSVDPLASKYPGMSPYNFVANNPIINVDIDGREIIPWAYRYDDIELFVSQLKQVTSLDIRYDYLSNKITITGTPTNELEELLFYAAHDEKVKVNLYLIRSSFFKNSANDERSSIVLGGSFLGNKEVNIDGQSYLEAEQIININHMIIADQENVQKMGKSFSHELIEAYAGAVLYPNQQSTGRNLDESSAKAYNTVHNLSDRLAQTSMEVQVVGHNKDTTPKFVLRSDTGTSSVQNVSTKYTDKESIKYNQYRMRAILNYINVKTSNEKKSTNTD